MGYIMYFRLVKGVILCHTSLYRLMEQFTDKEYRDSRRHPPRRRSGASLASPRDSGEGRGFPARRTKGSGRRSFPSTMTARVQRTKIPRPIFGRILKQAIEMLQKCKKPGSSDQICKCYKNVKKQRRSCDLPKFYRKTGGCASKVGEFMTAPPCTRCGKRHWSSQACAAKKRKEKKANAPNAPKA